ncbi:MAG: amidinotransferase [Deltaproteobacteria bacterium]|nr:amidinotransferase [Deltaproteobacteria bacterium]
MAVIAVTREVSACFADAITTWEGGQPDAELARRQHHSYLDALRWLGAELRTLPALSGAPDAVFVEDMAVVARGRVLATRSGAPARRAESPAVLEALAEAGELVQMSDPATLDGGDVLWVGDRMFVGVSGRTNRAGVAALAACFDPVGIRVIPVPVAAGLHLKSACSSPAPGLILVADAVLDPTPFRAAGRVLAVPPAESYAANSLGWGGRALLPAGFPVVSALLRAEGLEVRELDQSEIRKADGALTCMSVLFEAQPPR